MYRLFPNSLQNTKLSTNVLFIQVSLEFLHLQDAVHGLGLQPHRAVLHPVVQAQVISSSQASGTGGSDIS